MKKKQKVLIIGWDAADWKIINSLMDAGEMPSMEYLVNNGVMGNLATLDPPFSPMLWTSIATGVRPDKHGILGFVEPTTNKIGLRPVSSTSRKVKAIWNILTQKGYKSHVVGWWPSNPVEPINGIMLSNHYQKMNEDKQMPLQKGNVHPVELSGLFGHLRIHPSELTAEHLLPFVPKAAEIDQENDKRLFNIAKNIAETSTLHAATTWIAENQEWDFLALYLDSIDHFCHGFINYYPPKLKNIPEKDFEMFKGVVSAAYKFHDMMLGRLIKLAGEDTTIIVISDHGFHSDHLRPTLLPDEPAGPAYQHRNYGIFCMKGPDIKKDERIYGATLLDITPTLLYLFDLPIGEDMDGVPIVQAFKNQRKVKTIPSWEKVEGEAGMLPKTQQEDPYASVESLQQLVELGYIEEPEDDLQKNVENVVAESEYNLARVYMGAKKFDSALTILEELFKKEPFSSRFAFRLFDCYKATGNFEKCQSLINTFKEEIIKTIITKDELKKISEETMPDNLTQSEKEKFNNTKNKKQLNNKRIRRDLIQADLKQADIYLSERKNNKAFEIYNNITKIASDSYVLHLTIGYANLKIGKWKKGIECFNITVEKDSDNYDAHFGLGFAYLQLRKYEKAIDAFLESINLYYNSPKGHYYLAEALINIKDFENAANALNICLLIAPGFGKARNLLIEIYNDYMNMPELATKLMDYYEISKNNIKELIEENDDDKYKFVTELNIVSRDIKKIKSKGNPIIVVSGLPRSGTSLMMQMLEKAGVEIFSDNKRAADENNPLGYYEHEAVKKLDKESKWLKYAEGKAVKIISHLLEFLPSKHFYKIIFMNRDIDEIIKSQHKMLLRDGKAKTKSNDFPINLKIAFLNNLEKINLWAKKNYNAEIIYINHSDIIKNPVNEAIKILDFLDIKADSNKMASVVDKNLYREKK